MRISGVTVNGVNLSEFTVSVEDTKIWELPVYTVTDFFCRYCGIALGVKEENCEGHKLVIGGRKADGSEYGRFETEIWFKDGDLHLGCANPTLAQKAIYTFIHQYFKHDGSADIILPSDGTAKFNSSAADDWDKANPEKILSVQDRIIRGCYKLQAILEYDTADGKPFTYENKGYESTLAAARNNDNRTTNCVIVGNWVLKDAGFFEVGIYNHKYDGTFGYSLSGGSIMFFEKNFDIIDVRSRKKAVSEMVKDGELLPGDIIGFESHNQTILPLGCAFDGGRGLNTSRPAAGAEFLRWVGPNPYPDMLVGFIFRAKDAGKTFSNSGDVGSSCGKADKMENVIERGKCGPEAEYTVTQNEDGAKITVKGKGPTDDYAASKDSPFRKFRENTTEIEIEKGITGIGDRAFKEFENLRTLKLCAGIKYIGSETFSGCIMLEKVTFMKGLEILSPKAFDKNVSLKKITFPSTLRAVDFKTFGGCTALEKVTYRGSERQWNEKVRVSPSALGNTALQNAEFSFTEESSKYAKLCASLAAIIRRGGDGKLHIAAPDLTVPGVKGKSGDLTFIVFPDGQTMMIDSGAPFAENHVLNFLKALKITRLDWFVLSHPHSDHYGCGFAACSYLIEKKQGSVGHFLFAGVDNQREECRKLADYLRLSGTDMNEHVREGDVLDIGGVHVEVFNPDDAVLAVDRKGDDVVNNMSISMKFTYGESSFIASGDLYVGREKYLAEKYGDFLKADFIKSNHHGLFTSNTEAWIAAISPKYILTEDDGADWTRFEDSLKKLKIRHYRVSEKGLVSVTVSADRKYRFVTEY